MIAPIVDELAVEYGDRLRTVRARGQRTWRGVAFALGAAPRRPGALIWHTAVGPGQLAACACRPAGGGAMALCGVIAAAAGSKAGLSPKLQR